MSKYLKTQRLNLHW